jgi:hypothetical protein
VYQDLLFEKILLATIEKWPRDAFLSKQQILIQLDGAKAHTAACVEANWWEYQEQLVEAGMLKRENKFQLVLQLANSPDLNINDLGFFRALQSLYYQEAPRNEGEIITMVENAYRLYPWRKINRLWLTLQSCMNEIVMYHGENTYNIPHTNKEKLEREGNLPENLPLCTEIVTYTEQTYPDIRELAEISSSECESSDEEEDVVE